MTDSPVGAPEEAAVPTTRKCLAITGYCDGEYAYHCGQPLPCDRHPASPAVAVPGETIRTIQEINAARSARWMAGSPGWTTLEIAGELAGEVGELANVCKKLRRSEMGVPGNKVSDDELREMARGEIADVFIVLMLTASKLGIDLEDAVRETFNRKSEQMGFPERIGNHAAALTTSARHRDALREAVEAFLTSWDAMTPHTTWDAPLIADLRAALPSAADQPTLARANQRGVHG